LCPSELREVILAHGHENISATHRTTFEITREVGLLRTGNCIIGVSADKALGDLSLDLKRNLRKRGARVKIAIRAGDVAETVVAFGSPRLILAHPADIVVRKSDYISNRTLAVKADKAAYDLSRKLVEKLRSPTQRVEITLTIETRGF
jgi:hypothetical protein